MSDLQLQNLSNQTTDSLTTEETSLIMGGHSAADCDFLKSMFGDIDFNDPNAIKDSLSKLDSNDFKSAEAGKKADNVKANNVIFGTPGDDVIRT